MADDKHGEAMLIVTKRVIANALNTDYPTAPEWSEYPEIGQHDWTEIARRVKAEANGRYGVNDESYEAAYEFLDARADAE